MEGEERRIKWMGRVGFNDFVWNFFFFFFFKEGRGGIWSDLEFWMGILPKEVNTVPEAIPVWPTVRYISGTGQYRCTVSRLPLIYIYIYVYKILKWQILYKLIYLFTFQIFTSFCSNYFKLKPSPFHYSIKKNKKP